MPHTLAKLRRMTSGPPTQPAGAPPSSSDPDQSGAAGGAVATVRHAGRELLDLWAIKSDSRYRKLAEGYHFPEGYKRVYCHHIRKTAGTSLWLSFMALGGEDPLEVYRRLTRDKLNRTVSGGYSFAIFHRRLLAEGAYFFGRSHRPAESQPLPPRTFTVTILRDPVSRVRSYFDYLVNGDPPGMPRPVGPGERSLADGGFDRFLDRVPQRHLLTQLLTFSERYDVSEAVDRVAACSSIFFTEDFGEGMAALATRLDLPLEVRRDRVTGERSDLTAAQVERVRAMLEPEYQLLSRLEAGGIARIGSVESV